MPISPIVEYAPGDLITAAWANTIAANQRLLDTRTGNDPGDPVGQFLVSATGIGGDWRLLQTGDFRANLIPSSSMIDQKVNQVSPARASFAAAEASGFYDIYNPPDGPFAGAYYWHLIQSRYGAGGDYRIQIGAYHGDPIHLYTRLVVNGTPTPWRKLWHAGNLAPADITTVLGYTPIPNTGANITGNYYCTNGQIRANNLYSDTTIGAAGAISAAGNIASSGSMSAGGNIDAVNGTVTAAALISSGIIRADNAQIRGAELLSLGNLRAPQGKIDALELDLSGSTAGYGLRAAGAISVAGITLPGTGVWSGGARNSGQIRVNQLLVGVAGIDSDGPITIQGQGVYWPGNPPPGGGSGGTGGNVPSGAVVIWTGSSLPAGGWNFYTSLNDRFPLGAGPGHGLGGTGGSATHAHTVNIQHDHTQNLGHVGGGIGGVQGTSTRLDGPNPVASDAHTHTYTAPNNHTSNTGLGGSTSLAVPATTENSMPPYLAVNYIIKT